MVNPNLPIPLKKIIYGETPEGFDIGQEALDLQPNNVYVIHVDTNVGIGIAHFKIVEEGEKHKLIAISYDEMGDMISEARRKKNNP